MSSDKMELWNKVCETDPKYTKPVKFGRGFTAIDPMYQIRTATEQFGPAGEKWGWQVMDTKFLPTDQVAVLVRLNTGDSYIEQWGQCGMYTDNEKTKTDSDCMKKATTDGLTKCLSYLGFNADVFMGKFDDNKYVQAMKEKHENSGKKTIANGVAPVQKSADKELNDWWAGRRDYLNELIKEGATIERFDAVWNKIQYCDSFKEITEEMQGVLNDQYDSGRIQLGGTQ